MPVTVYSRRPGRRTWQVTGDVLLLAWVALWVWVGRGVHSLVEAVAAPGRGLESGASTVADSLRSAGETASGLPVVGGRLEGPLVTAGDAADSIAAAGTDLAEAVEDLALLLAVVVAGAPVLLVAVLWVPARVRFVRRASAAGALVSAAPDLSLFALRALASQPLGRLAAISPDPVGAWRDGDPVVVRALADLELRDLGLRPPPVVTGAPGDRPALD